MSNSKNNIVAKKDYYAFSAPSGAGKTTIIKKLLDKYDNITVSVSVTTRPMRKGEVNGVDYYFISKEKFEEYIKEDKFLEYEEVHHNYYGTLKQTVNDLVASGKVVIFDIDVNGALNIKKSYEDTVLIFIKPPSIEVLIERLKNRKSETEESLKKRLQRIDYEYSKAEYFDYIVINDKLEDAVKDIEDIIAGKR